MKKKIIGILICMLLIATAIPAVGTTNKINSILTDTSIPTCYKNDRCSISSYGIEWEKTYGGSESDKFWEVQETEDGGYIACGTTETSNNICPWVVKVDSDGNEEWNWTISEFFYNDTDVIITYCWCDDVQQTQDGGYIACLMLLFDYSQVEHSVGGLVKLDSNGLEKWIQIYGEEFEWTILPESIMVVEDGFIGVGSHSPTESDSLDRAFCIFKTDTAGELIWHKVHNFGPIYDWARGFCNTDDGGYLIVGDVTIIADVEWHACIIKTDAQGVELWNKSFKNGGSFSNVFQTSDGGYLLGGYTNSYGAGSYDIWLVKTDGDGNEIWNRTFGGTGYDLMGYSGFDSTGDDGCISPAMIGIGTGDGWVIKTDSDGNVEWKHIYGGVGAQFFIGLSPTSDGGCIASGISGYWDDTSSDALLVKYAAFENQRPEKPDKPSGKKKGTPGAMYTYKSSTSDSDDDQLEYFWDWGDGNFSEWLGPYNSGEVCEAEYYWEDEGEYSVKVMARDSNGGESDWSDPLPVKMPKNKAYIFNFPIFSWLFERFSNSFPILRYMLGK